MKDRNNIKVFVYGSLRSGMRLNHVLTDRGATFLSEGTTKENFYIHDLEYFPGLEKNVDGVRVHGEIWLVSENCLSYLDILEGVPTLYYRSIEKIQSADSKICSCFLYLLSHQELKVQANIVETDDWKNYYEKKKAGKL